MHYPTQTDVESVPYPLARLMMKEWLEAHYNQPPDQPVPCVLNELFETVPADGYHAYANDLGDSFILFSMYQHRLINQETLEAWVRIQLDAPPSNSPDFRHVAEALQALDVFNEFEFDRIEPVPLFPPFLDKLRGAFYGYFDKIGEPGHPTLLESGHVKFYQWLIDIEEQYVDDFKMTLERFVTFHIRYSYLEVNVRYLDDEATYAMFHEPYSSYLDKLGQYSVQCEGIDLTRMKGVPERFVRYIQMFNPIRGGGFSCIKSL